MTKIYPANPESQNNLQAQLKYVAVHLIQNTFCWGQTQPQRLFSVTLVFYRVNGAGNKMKGIKTKQKAGPI